MQSSNISPSFLVRPFCTEAHAYFIGCWRIKQYFWSLLREPDKNFQATVRHTVPCTTFTPKNCCNIYSTHALLSQVMLLCVTQLQKPPATVVLPLCVAPPPHLILLPEKALHSYKNKIEGGGEEKGSSLCLFFGQLCKWESQVAAG